MTAVAASGLSSAILAPALGFLGNYFAYRRGMDGAQSDYERDYIKRFYRKLIAWILGFLAAYGLLMIWAKQFVMDRHLVYSSLIFGLVLPFTFVLFAHNFAVGGIAHALQANNDAAGSYFQQNLLFRHPRLLLRYLAWLNLLWVIPMFARWRVVAAGRCRRNVGR